MLRQRLFLNLLPFVIVLLAICVYAISLYLRLAERVDTTVTNSYASLTAAHTMGLALGNMDREISLVTVAGQKTTDKATFRNLQNRFEDNLNVLFAQSTPETELLNQRLATNFYLFKEAVIAIGTNADSAFRHEIYDKQLIPVVLKMQALLENIRDINHKEILATSRNVRTITHDVIQLMIIGTIIGLVISIYASVALGRSILQPIQLLTRATHELGEGKLQHPVPTFSRDEFGELATAFNKMALQLQEYRQSTAAQIVRLHRTMETTLATFPDPIFVLNQDREIELKNTAAEELLSSPGGNIDWSNRLKTFAQKTFETGKNYLPYNFEEGISYRANGADKFFLPRVVAMRDMENAVTGVAVVLYDVTRFRLMDAAKTNLVATVSHELKTPLTSVRMALYMLLEQNFGPLTPKQDQLLQTARNDAERLLRILNDLLDLARLEQGNADLRKEKITPVELLQIVNEEMAEQIAAKGLTLHCKSEPDLPSIWVDPQRIKYVFANLIINAAKYSPANGKITLRAAPAEDGNVEFTVTDQGPGIREEHHVRIFDRFFRVPDAAKPGAGLGLSIAKEITVAHGGRIGVRNAPEGGSTFFVLLKGDVFSATQTAHAE